MAKTDLKHNFERNKIFEARRQDPPPNCTNTIQRFPKTNLLFRFLSVGGESVWAINPADEVFVRVNLTKADPRGKEWTKIDGSMKTLSVGPTGVCWAVDKKDTVWRRLGAKTSNPIGSKWQSVTGRLSHITVGQSGVWGLSPKHEVIFRDGTYGLPGDADGSGWTKVDGMMTWLSSGENIVWAVSANGALWYRAGIEQSCPMGTNWFRVDTANDKYVSFKEFFCVTKRL